MLVQWAVGLRGRVTLVGGAEAEASGVELSF